MSVNALVLAFTLILLIGLFMLVGVRDVWRNLFKGGRELESLVDRRYLGKK